MSEMEYRKFGYLHGEDDYDRIDEGLEPEDMLRRFAATYPEFNAYANPWLSLQYQGSQGACQGHALAHAFQVALTQEYSIQTKFSRACAYYLSQKEDGINGDRGSTLAGGQKVAAKGICLEDEWPYPSRYNNRMPNSAVGRCDFKMPGSKRITDADLAFSLIEAGACIQTGVAWNSSYEKEVCDRLSSTRGGGHSTLLYGLDEKTGNAIHHNSWNNWQGDGRNQWTKRFLDEIMRKDRFAVFVCYDSTMLEVPEAFMRRVPGVDQ